MLRGIKLRIYLNEEQELYARNILNTSRFVYNKCLAYRIDKYQNEGLNLKMKDTSKYLTSLKQVEEFSWIKDSHSKVLQQNLIDLDQAYKSFFNNGNGFPKFKSRKHKQSCRFPVDAISSVKGNRNHLIHPSNVVVNLL